MKNIVRYCLLSFFVLFSLLSLESEKTAHAASGPINIGFNPYDTAVDLDKPIVYMTEKGSKTIYAVNYETGVIDTLSLPYPAERLELYNQKLYVTQHKLPRDNYNLLPNAGGIAEVDTERFTLNGVIDVETDPYDIAIDQNGFIYITPGSGQREELKVYSLIDKEVINNTEEANGRSMIYYSEATSKVYTINSEGTPRDIYAFEVNNGFIKDKYDSFYHGEYKFNPTAKMSPDGLSLYNHSGVVFELAPSKPSDMHLQFEFNQGYKDFAFNEKDQLTFAARKSSGIDVYTYNTKDYLYTIKKNLFVEQLHYKNGLIAIYTNGKEDYFLDFFNNHQSEAFSLGESLFYKGSNKYEVFWGELVNGTINIPTNSSFQFDFNQKLADFDKSKIKLEGPDGFVEVFNKIDNGILKIYLESLQEYTSYTLRIDGGAVSSYLGEKLSDNQVIQFRTKASPVTGVSLTVDTSKAPKEYIFTANATGGVNPQYEFLINDNGQEKILQEYSSSQSFVWHPTKKGTYYFVVHSKSVDSEAWYEKAYVFNQKVIDSVFPTAVFKAETNATKDKVKITVTAKDNAGVKSIKLPNGVIVNDSTAIFTASESGTYKFDIEDIFGNVNTESFSVDNIKRIDSKILLTASTYALTKGNVIITVNASDTVGVKRIVLPNGKLVDKSTALFPVSKNGVYTFYIHDNAQNITAKTINIRNIHKD